MLVSSSVVGATSTIDYPLSDTATIGSDTPTTTNPGSNGYLLVHYQAAGTTRALGHFNTFGITDANEITSATFYGLVTGSDGNTGFYLYPVTSSWTYTTVTWNTQPTAGSLQCSDPSGSVTLWRTCDVTSLAKSWANSSVVNNGIELRANETVFAPSTIFDVNPNAAYIRLIGNFNTPSTPSITSPANNSITLEDTTNIIWSASTDADGDSITYNWQLSNDTTFSTNLIQGNTSSLQSGSQNIAPGMIYNMRVKSNDSIHVSAWSPIIRLYTNMPILYTPLDDSAQYKTYPPLTTTINFTWQYMDLQTSNILIAKDSNFNLISVNTITSNNYSAQSLEAGNYWWKVRYYSSTSGTYGNYSDTSNFTLINNVSATGTGIHGVVYELINGVQTPISNARVIVRNEVLNWTSEQSTGTNGYYLFSNLTNSTTYNLYATRSDVYKDSVAYYVATGTGTISTQNILLERCYSGFDCFYNQAYVKFTVKNMMFGWTYSDVAISVYEGDGIVAVNTGTTKSDGSVTFLLKKDQEYRITAIKASDDIDAHIHIIPGNSVDVIIPIWSFTENREDSVSWNLSAVDNDATTTYLNLTYADTSGLTTQINFWVLNGTNTSQTIYSTSTSSSSLNAGVAVNDTTRGSFIYGFNATRNGVVITENKVITFTGSTPLIDLKIDNKYYVWISLIFLTSLALLFSKNTNRNGYILIPLIALFLSWLGMFPVSYLITASALVIGVIAYLRSAEKKSEVTY